MTTLTNYDFEWLKRYIQSDTTFRNTLKTWGISKPNLKSAIQAIENYNVSAYNVTPTSTIQQTIEAFTGAITATQAKVLWYAWAAWRGEFKL